MPVKKQPTAKAAPAPRRASTVATSVVGARPKAQPAPKAQPMEKAPRPAPTRVSRPQVVTHVKTMSNGEPRPKSRRTK